MQSWKWILHCFGMGISAQQQAKYGGNDYALS